MLPIYRAFTFLPFTKNIPLFPYKTTCFTQSRESPLDSCRPMSLSSYRLENGYAIFADSKQRSRPLSFLSRMGKVLQALRLWNFCVLIFSYENCLQKFSASSSAVFSRHSLTQFSNLSFLICPLKSQFSPLKSVFSLSHFSVFRKSSRFRVAFHPSFSRRDVSMA